MGGIVMEEIYLSVGSAAAARKGKILELIKKIRGSARLSLTLHSNDHHDNHVDPSWVYDYDTDSRQVDTIVETLDRHLADAFGGNPDQYRIASIKIIKSGLNHGGPSRHAPKSAGRGSAD
jgi:hypothetical protein